jgi:hypothetical protein
MSWRGGGGARAVSTKQTNRDRFEQPVETNEEQKATALKIGSPPAPGQAAHDCICHKPRAAKAKTVRARHRRGIAEKGSAPVRFHQNGKILQNEWSQL